MARYEFRSRVVYQGDYDDQIEQMCNALAEEGFVVFSVVCPDPSNYKTFRVTARRDNEESHTPKMFTETK